MTQQPPDHIQSGVAGDQQLGEGVAKVVDADVVDFGLQAQPLSESLEIDHNLARHIAGERKGQYLGTASPHSQIKVTAFCEIGTRCTRSCLM